ncbi:acyltransferase family protein [Lonsdalea quercina]|uniref:acyltransferase family protein n=1 Tax=Lonsdalea quercina TaxID=71657 RepID=UPI0039764FA9
MRTEKIIFADQLRSLAFLSVVIVHWIGVYSIHKDTVSRLTFSPVSESNFGYIYRAITLPLPEFNYGPFGVSIFFLISGFVVSFSLKNRDSKKFLTARLMRIYPTYIICLIVMLAVLYSTSYFYWNVIPSLGFGNILSNAFLINNLIGVPSIDAVNWTLAIEVKFYIICAIFRHFIITRGLTSAFLFSVLSSLLSYLAREVRFPSWLVELSHEFSFISYMFIGLCFYLALSGKASKFSAAATALICFTSFSYFIYANHPIKLFFVLFCNYSYSILLFLACYIIKNKFKKIGVISYLSKISYPFYALHSVIGYAILRILEDIGINFYISLALTFTFVLMTSSIVCLTIERRTMTMRQG